MDLLAMKTEEVARAIRNGKVTVVVVGTGYVGLQLAAHFAEANATVIGADINPKVVKKVNEGMSPFFEPKLDDLIMKNVCADRLIATTNVIEAVKKADVVIVSVPTPVNQNNKPNLSCVKRAATMVGRGLKRGAIVIIASTVYIGATRNVVLPILEKESGLVVGKDFGLATVPERIDPGNLIHRLDNTPINVGGIDERSTEIAAVIFEMIVNAEVKRVKSLEVAEASKLVENVYRDLNIAFVNELALFFEKLGLDVLEVIDACSTKWSFQPHFPGAGVGGSCIPVNPYYLLQGSTPSDLKLVRIARRINNSMPDHVVNMVVEVLSEVNKRVENSKIAILGLAHKGNTDDTRYSPAERIIEKIKKMSGKVAVHDPMLPVSHLIFGCLNLDFEEAVKDADCLVFVTDHNVFRKISIKRLRQLAHNPAAIIDGRNIFRPLDVVDMGFCYVGVGRRDGSILSR